MSTIKTPINILLTIGMLLLFAESAIGQRMMENLGRGVIAVRRSSTQVYIGWRLLGTDPSNISFNLYRATGNGAAIRINGTAITSSTNFVDSSADLGQSNRYFVRPIINGAEQEDSTSFTLPANAPVRQYISIPLRTDLSYGAFHVGTGDLDGDGEYDFVVKRGSQDTDPSQGGGSNNTFKLEGYKNNGQFLWRIDLGWNIEQGIWYSPIMVYDLDGDCKAEVIAKISEGTRDGAGVLIGDTNSDGRTDYRDPAQGNRVLSGPEFLGVFSGTNGRLLARADWPERGAVSDWGDNYGNRVNRNLMGIAYIDGQRPSLIAFRGTYTKMYADAWNWRNGSLTRVWRWFRASGGGGYHNIRVSDIDNDGRDEIINGSIAINDNGATMWITGEGHGDRVHLTDINPDRPGKEIFYIQEGGYTHPYSLRDAATGIFLWGPSGNQGDVGRGLCADIHSGVRGLECWASVGNLNGATGASLGARPSQVNMAIWWDGDVTRELLDGNHIDKWNTNNTLTRLLTADGVFVASRSAPAGYGDVFGDWREEVWYIVGNSELRIYTTTIEANNRFYTLMHDSDYRTSVACETMGYMQATQPGFYFGNGMSAPPAPNIVAPNCDTSSEAISGVYRLINRNSGKALDVEESSTANGANIIQWADTGGINQQWRIISLGGGYYTLTAQHSGQVLDVNGRSTADGADVIQWPSTGATNQQWLIENMGGGNYRLTARHSGKCLTVLNGSTADGANVEQRTDGGNNWQRWQLVLVSQ
jgi:rhamnogalacturonan endolyase